MLTMKSYEIALLVVFLIVWIYLLVLLKRKKLSAYFFILGVSGFFMSMFLVFKSALAKVCTIILMDILEPLSHVLKYYTVYKAYNIIFVDHANTAISLFIDYECSGVIEVFCVLSIVLFFPMFHWKDKIIYSIIGVIYTMAANVIRLLLITAMVYKYGNNAYYVAHSVLGRIVFYVLTLFLYFYMLSWKQIKSQKVGSFSFSSKEDKAKKQLEGSEEAPNDEL